MTTTPSVEFEVTVVVATPLALVVRTAGFNETNVKSLTVKVTTWLGEAPKQSRTVAVTVAVLPPTARGLGITVRFKFVAIAGVMILIVAVSISSGEAVVAWIVARLEGVLPVRVEVKMPALLVLPGLGEKSLVAPGIRARFTSLLGMALPKASVRVVVTAAVWQTLIEVGTAVTVRVVGTLGRISTSTVPVMVPLIAVIVSKAGDVAEKTRKLPTLNPLTKVVEIGVIVPVVSLIVTVSLAEVTRLPKTSTAVMLMGKVTPAVCGEVAARMKRSTAPGVKVTMVVVIMELLAPLI